MSEIMILPNGKHVLLNDYKILFQHAQKICKEDKELHKKFLDIVSLKKFNVKDVPASMINRLRNNNKVYSEGEEEVIYENYKPITDELMSEVWDMIEEETNERRVGRRWIRGKLETARRFPIIKKGRDLTEKQAKTEVQKWRQLQKQ